MANIRIDLEATVINGQALTFKSPVDCSQITGLKVYYPVGDATASKTFQFADAHGNNVGNINLFAENVLVKVILDTDLNRAYVQNADTNAYLEAQLASKAPGGYGLGTTAKAVDSLDDAIGNGFYYSKNGGPFSDFWYAFAHSYDNTGAWVIQEVWNNIASGVGNVHAVRRKSNGVWGPWEFVCPPMYLNIEYRTAERYGGKPVYVKRIPFDALASVGANTEESTVSATVCTEDATIIHVCAEGWMSSLPTFRMEFPMLTDAGEVIASIRKNGNILKIVSHNNTARNFAAECTVKYVKN